MAALLGSGLARHLGDARHAQCGGGPGHEVAGEQIGVGEDRGVTGRGTAHERQAHDEQHVEGQVDHGPPEQQPRLGGDRARSVGPAGLAEAARPRHGAHHHGEGHRRHGQHRPAQGELLGGVDQKAVRHEARDRAGDVGAGDHVEASADRQEGRATGCQQLERHGPAEDRQRLLGHRASLGRQSRGEQRRERAGERSRGQQHRQSHDHERPRQLARTQARAGLDQQRGGRQPEALAEDPDRGVERKGDEEPIGELARAVAAEVEDRLGSRRRRHRERGHRQRKSRSGLASRVVRGGRRLRRGCFSDAHTSATAEDRSFSRRSRAFRRCSAR